MIIGINGAFGAGKTQAAYELQRRRKGAYVYDPENLGFLSGTTFLPPLFREHPVNDKAQASCQQQTAWTSVFRLHPAKAEGCDQLLQHAGLGAQLLTGSGALLGGGRVGLHHTGNLSNLILNLFHRAGLGLCVGGNPVDGLHNFTRACHDAVQLLGGSIRNLRPLIHCGNGTPDQR